MLSFDTPVDSLAFGAAGSNLQELLFVSGNDGQLTMVDLVTLQRIAVATGGSRGDIVATTARGAILVSQSSQIDVLLAETAPQVVSVNPPPLATVVLPLGQITLTFD
ncbi:MAG: hypothetical protein GTO03_03555, partial [Planctomycetales bacterium]|nr:hypothetical protein [Planctomycetales bacterium]